MAGFTVIYDACVLYPAPLRDLLIELAASSLFRARWTATIHEEWMSSLLASRADLTRAQLTRTRELMDAAVLDCLVTGYEHFIPVLSLPDENDRHVAAAAIQAKANAIVTFNLKDFPPDLLAPFALEAIHPDEFVTYQLDLDQAAVLVAAQRCRRRLRNPPRSADEYLDALRAQSLPKTAATLRAYRAIL